MSAVLTTLIVVCGVWAVAASILIAKDLARRGLPVSIVWFRLVVLKYLGEYCAVTKKKTGRVGPLLYYYVVPLNVALVLAIALAAVELA